MSNNNLGAYSGTDADDVTTGNDTDDQIDGLLGNDKLDGGADRGYLSGGADEDTLVGGDDVDKLYGDDGDDVIFGDAGADYLWGGDGDDVPWGGAGDDVLWGGAGDDNLYGGSGSDLFIAGEGGIDTVTDFQVGYDHVVVDDNFYSLAGDDHDGYHIYNIRSLDAVVITKDVLDDAEINAGDFSLSAVETGLILENIDPDEFSAYRDILESHQPWDEVVAETINDVFDYLF